MKKVSFNRNYNCVCHRGKVWGKMPISQEIREFDTVFQYEQACRLEEDEFIDELARLEAEKELEYPEDFKVV